MSPTRTSSLLGAVAAALLATSPARAADTWSETASAADAADAADAARADDYAKALDDGDRATLLATSESTSASRMKRLVLEAARDYEAAAAARPDLAEPHWRAANLLYGFFIDCDGGFGALCLGDTVDPALYRRIIDHWDAVERIDPLDPRLGVHWSDLGVLLKRAIMRTRLATDDDLAAATDDYLALLERDEADDPRRGQVLGNLAETYMMRGDLDDAIVRYREAIDVYADISITYGLAVAYDRDGQGAKARELIAALGVTGFQAWDQSVVDGGTFYVPEGEVFYYYGLAREALGDPTGAIADYRRFVASGAHPIYAARAQEDLDALVAKQRHHAGKPK